jgi:hypothetical protein
MTLEQAVDKATLKIFSKMDDGFDVILSEVVQAASRYFTECPDDFCVQNVAYKSIVFGGTNRLVWNASTGFTPDRPYCTESFLRRCASLGDLPRGQ